MKRLWLSLGILAGILCCALGIVLILLTGFDPRWSALGIVLVLAGGLCAWALHRRGGTTTAEETPMRSHPPEALPPGKHERKPCGEHRS